MQKFSTYLLALLFFVTSSKLYSLSPPDPLVNIIQGHGVMGLNFSGPGTNEQIALFVISSNSTTGFDVTFEFANSCKFISGTKVVPMTALLLDKVSGTLGDDLTEPIDLDVLHNLSGGNQYLWDPGDSQSTETLNYIVELKASWVTNAGALAGFYFENVTATIRVGL